MARCVWLCGWVVLLGFGTRAGAEVMVNDEAQTKADLAAFRAYLAKNFPGKKWQTGPTLLQSEELGKAYGKQRFYYVYTSPPFPPGANLRELIERYQRAMEEYQKNAISLTVSFAEDGTLTALRKPEDFARGLLPVTADAEAKVAAAALLSLYGHEKVGPVAISAQEVRVTRSKQGWTCTVNRPNAFTGTVGFDAEGRLIQIAKNFTGPLPP